LKAGGRDVSGEGGLVVWEGQSMSVYKEGKKTPFFGDGRKMGKDVVWGEGA